MTTASDNSDRIETDYLKNGIFNRLMLYVRRNMEVFQLIVDEGNMILRCLFLNVLQDIRHRHIMKVMIDALCMNGQAQQEQQS